MRYNSSRCSIDASGSGWDWCYCCPRTINVCSWLVADMPRGH